MTRPAGLIVLAALATPRPGWGCEEDATTADLRIVIEEAEAAYIALDSDGVRDRLDALAALTPCLSEAIPRPDAARYHRIQGLGAFIGRDSEAASPRAFLAARSIEPDAALPSSLVPDGHPVQRLYTQLSVTDRTFGPLPEPAGGYLLLDGRQDDQRPLSHPVLLQRIQDTGGVAQSAYLWPDDSLPPFPVAPPVALVTEPVVAEPAGDPVAAEPITEPITEPDRAPGGKVVVIVGTGAAAVVTGAALAVNRGRYTQYSAAGRTEAELDVLRDKVNRSGALTLGSAALAGAGGLALALVW